MNLASCTSIIDAAVSPILASLRVNLPLPGDANKCAESSELKESSELNACSGFDSLELTYTGSSSATALGRPVQMTTGVQG